MTSLFTEHNGLPVDLWAGGEYGRKTDHIRNGDAAGILFMSLPPWKFILPS